MVKRAFDFTVALLSLILLSPLFLVIALLIKRDSSGPVFYRGLRVGKGCKPFRMFKFRTMVRDADALGPGITLQGDSRITKAGRRLRKTKLDELPQLINVLRGEMSLVGPRPEIPEIVECYTPLQRRLLAIRPGMTSPASLAYRNEEDLIGSDVKRYAEQVLPAKLALDLRYFLRSDLWTDLKIIWRTAALTFGSESLALRWALRLVRRHVPWTLIDAPIVVAAFYAALLLRLLDIPASDDVAYVGALTGALPILLLLYLASNSLWGVHRRIWRFATAADVRPIFASTVTATIAAFLLDVLAARRGLRPIPLGVILLGGFFTASGMVLVRYRSRLVRGLSQNRSKIEGTRTLIYGAGDAGQHLALRLLTNREGEPYSLVGFADDDVRKRGQRIHDLPVLGGRSELSQIVERNRIELIVIAIHSISGEDLRQIVTAVQQTPAQIKIIPNLFETVRNPNTAPLLREVRVEDLLGRQALELNRHACERVLRGKVVLITGGCGSVGSELCRQVLQFHPQQLVVLDNNETGLYDLEVSLRSVARGISLTTVVGDVTNRSRLEWAFSKFRPQVIFHAAAYKHVPLMERFPQEAVRVNVGGTLLTLEVARAFGAEYFVFVSTDKAVEPHSVMGATKRIAEMLVVGSNNGHSNGQTLKCTAVRFGNVLGSRGSVVPTFARQIELGGPVTVTHRDMTRYFMDISEAAGLIIQAASFTRGGDIFMLDMGERIKVDDLARKMIRMRGLRPEVDIPIVYTGVRPGEKLHEELVFPEEGREATDHPHIHRVNVSAETTRNGDLSSAVQRLLELSANGHEHKLVEELMHYARGSSGRTTAGSASTRR